MVELATTVAIVCGTNPSHPYAISSLYMSAEYTCSLLVRKKLLYGLWLEQSQRTDCCLSVSLFIIFFVFLIRLWNPGYFTYFCLPAMIKRGECENSCWSGGLWSFFCKKYLIRIYISLLQFSSCTYVTFIYFFTGE